MKKDKDNEVLLEIHGITKRFPGVHALKDISVSIRKHEILGFAGENGAGKSTLLKVLAGVHKPDTGSMRLGGADYQPKNYREASSLGVSMVFQEQNLVPNLCGYENIFLSHEDHFVGKNGLLDRRSMIARTRSFFEQFGLEANPAKPVSTYTFHQRQLLEILRAFIISELYGISSPLILLDEPTASLSEAERDLLFSKVREYSDRATFCLISHRLSEMMTYCSRIVVLKDGAYVDEVVPEEATERILHSMMVGREFSGDTYQVGRQMELTELTSALRVEGLCHEGAYRDITLELYRGEILGIGGLVGCGKRDLGKDIFGIEHFDAGTVFLGGEPVTGLSIQKMVKGGVGYIPAERKGFGIIEYLPIGWNLTLPSIFSLKNRFLMLDRSKERALVDRFIKEFKIKATSESMGFSLSGGNQQKVVLAKWIAKDLDILILDNPTRGIDVGAKEEIYSLLRTIVKQGVAVLLITDDLLELIGLSNRIIIMKEGRISSQKETGKSEKPSEKELVQYMV
jgi:ribose transport system ATP-binding protein